MLKFMESKSKYQFSYRVFYAIILHLLFWSIYILSLSLLYYLRETEDWRNHILEMFILLPVVISATYFTTYFIIPNLYKTSNWRRIFVLFLASIIIFSIIHRILILKVIWQRLGLFYPGTENILSYQLFHSIGKIYSVVIIAVIIKLISSRIQDLRAKKELERVNLETNLKLKEAEIKFLRSQINPHFLFNTINNLYGLTLEKSDLAPSAVIQLSNLLSYMLYDCNEPVVSLDKEISHLKSYLSLEKLRFGKRLKTEFDIIGNTEHYMIAPLLFLPFFENSIKHGTNIRILNPIITVFFHIQKNTLLFSIINKTEENESNSKIEFGLGLNNIKKRLKLQYPNKHTLNLYKEKEYFKAELLIELDKYKST